MNETQDSRRTIIVVVVIVAVGLLLSLLAGALAGGVAGYFVGRQQGRIAAESAVDEIALQGLVPLPLLPLDCTQISMCLAKAGIGYQRFAEIRFCRLPVVSPICQNSFQIQSRCRRWVEGKRAIRVIFGSAEIFKALLTIPVKLELSFVLFVHLGQIRKCRIPSLFAPFASIS